MNCTIVQGSPSSQLENSRIIGWSECLWCDHVVLCVKMVNSRLFSNVTSLLASRSTATRKKKRFRIDKYVAKAATGLPEMKGLRVEFNLRRLTILEFYREKDLVFSLRPFRRR